jgi:hypothetical protein
MRVAPNPNVNGNLVQFAVTVTDSSGKWVSGLSKDSFRATHSGQQVPVEFLSANAPASIGLVIDTSNSMTGKIDRVRLSVAQFIGGLNPSDDIFLFAFTYRPSLL